MLTDEVAQQLHVAHLCKLGVELGLQAIQNVDRLANGQLTHGRQHDEGDVSVRRQDSEFLEIQLQDGDDSMAVGLAFPSRGLQSKALHVDGAVPSALSPHVVPLVVAETLLATFPFGGDAVHTHRHARATDDLVQERLLLEAMLELVTDVLDEAFLEGCAPEP